jgi:putative effector of murein hydrolase
MESALNHLFHSVILAVILYVLMRFILKQSQNMSLNRSILIAAVALIYMILFGHGLPTHINKI